MGPPVKQFTVIKENMVRKALFKGEGHIPHRGRVAPVAGEKLFKGIGTCAVILRRS